MIEKKCENHYVIQLEPGDIIEDAMLHALASLKRTGKNFRIKLENKNETDLVSMIYERIKESGEQKKKERECEMTAARAHEEELLKRLEIVEKLQERECSTALSEDNPGIRSNISVKEIKKYVSYYFDTYEICYYFGDTYDEAEEKTSADASVVWSKISTDELEYLLSKIAK